MHSLTGKSQYSGFTKSLTGRGFSNSKSAAAAGSSVTVAQLPVNIPHSKLADHAHNGAVVHTNPSTGEMETVRVLDASGGKRSSSAAVEAKTSAIEEAVADGTVAASMRRRGVEVEKFDASLEE